MIEEKTSGESKGVIQLTVSLSFPRALFFSFQIFLPLLDRQLVRKEKERLTAANLLRVFPLHSVQIRQGILLFQHNGRDIQEKES